MARQKKGVELVKNAMAALGNRATVNDVRRYLFKGRAGDNALSRSQIAMAMKKVAKDAKQPRGRMPYKMIVGKSAKRSATAKTSAGGPTQIFRLGEKALKAAALYIRNDVVTAGRKRAATSSKKRSRGRPSKSSRGRKAASRKTKKSGHRIRRSYTTKRWAAVTRRRSSKTSKRR